MAQTAYIASPNPEHMLQEIRASIRARDAIKVRLVLEHLGSVERQVQHLLVYEMLRADADFTVPQLNRLVTHYPELCESLPVIRETLISHLIAHPDLIVSNLQDPGISDKRVFIQMAGEFKLEGAIDALMGVAWKTTDPVTIAAVVEALGIIGGPRAVESLAEFLAAADRELVISVIQAFRELGTPAAMQQAAAQLGRDDELDLLILGVFAEMQDETSLQQLNRAMRSSHARIRAFAKEQLASRGELALPVLLANLQEPDPDFLVHTLNVLGDIGSGHAILPIRRLLSSEPDNANVRFAAYEALARCPLSKGAFALAAGLTDREEHVCIAAARAIERNLNDVLVTGIKNLLKGENGDAQHIVKIIVNAQVELLFLSLAGDEDFQRLVLDCLPAAHEDIRNYHTQLLAAHGHAAFADAIARRYAAATAPIRTKICAVDDSRIVLCIYRATLHELGFEPVLFESPVHALAWLEQEQPALVLTDLNMPRMSGLEMAARIRQSFDADRLPIILVTTQSDVRTDEAVKKAGINDVLAKPFNAPQLLAAINRHLRAPAC